MRVSTFLSRLATGALLANTLPHLTQGISGHEFPTPFASPPGVGMSSPLVNVLWGSANLVFAYLLFARTRPFPSKMSLDALVLGVGFVGTAASLAVVFG